MPKKPSARKLAVTAIRQQEMEGHKLGIINSHLGNARYTLKKEENNKKEENIDYLDLLSKLHTEIEEKAKTANDLIKRLRNSINNDHNGGGGMRRKTRRRRIA